MTNEENVNNPDILDEDQNDSFPLILTPEFTETLVGKTREDAVKTIKSISPNFLCRVRSVDGKEQLELPTFVVIEQTFIS